MIALAKKRIVLHTLPASARHAALILMTCIPQMAVDFSLMLPRPGVSDKREAPASLADGYPRVISLGERRGVCGRMYSWHELSDMGGQGSDRCEKPFSQRGSQLFVARRGTLT
jgi:hypothetical protein